MPKRLGPSDMGSAVMDVRELSRRVREKRKGENLSVRQAATRAGISFSTLTRVEAEAQPDLATFLSLCAWLGIHPSAFFRPGAYKARDTLDEVTTHLMSDPSLSREAAEQIVTTVEAMYRALAQGTPSASDELFTCHLRAASALRPGVPQRLAALLKDMQGALEEHSR